MKTNKPKEIHKITYLSCKVCYSTQLPPATTIMHVMHPLGEHPVNETSLNKSLWWNTSSLGPRHVPHQESHVTHVQTFGMLGDNRAYRNGHDLLACRLYEGSIRGRDDAAKSRLPAAARLGEQLRDPSN